MSLIVNVRHLRLAQRSLIRDLRLEVPAGVVHTVMGASGSGKSSLLAAICGSLVPDFVFEGSVELDQVAIQDWPTQKRRIGILFQDDLLFAHMSVSENLLFAVPPGAGAQRRAIVERALQDLEMPEFGAADPATLSGGQRSRVALMRALLAEPKALLLDEPFSRLDAELRQRMRDFVFATVRSRNIPVLLVSHDEGDIADPMHLTRL